MKNLLLCSLGYLLIVGFTTQNSFSQTHRAEHEKPVIADFVPNIPQDLIEGGQLSKYVALSLPDDDRWNPDSLDLNTNGVVFTIDQERDINSCYIGGHFDSINGMPMKHIALFQDRLGGDFSDIGGGLEGGDVYTIIQGPNYKELYVGGNFKKAGNINANCIAHWTGSEWEALGKGTDSTVLALAIVGNTLYVGGNFRNADGQPVNYIAKWDITNKVWLPVFDGTMVGMNGGVAALSLNQSGDLIVGGGFTKAGTVAVNKIAQFNSGKWSALGSGVGGANAFVSCIASDNGYTNYVGGNFQLAGGIATSNMAYWSGDNWFDVSEFPGGFDGTVYTIAIPHPIFVGGDFKHCGNMICNFIAGSKSLSLGSGLDGPCYALAGRFIYLSLAGDFSNHLYVGGKFTKAGLKPSNNFAIWGEPGGGSVKQSPSLASQVSLRISPNPAEISSSVSFTLPNRMYTSLSVIDALGREVLSLGSGWHEAGVQQVPFEVKNLLNGVYYCSLQSEGQSVSAPFVVIR